MLTQGPCQCKENSLLNYPNASLRLTLPLKTSFPQQSLCLAGWIFMNRIKIILEVSGSLCIHPRSGWNTQMHTPKQSTMNAQSKNATRVQAVHASLSVQRDGLCFVCLAQFLGPRKLDKTGTQSAVRCMLSQMQTAFTRLLTGTVLRILGGDALAQPGELRRNKIWRKP